MKNNFLILLFVASLGTGLAQESYTLSDESSLTIDGTSSLHDWTVTANGMEGSLQGESDSANAIDFTVFVADIKSDRAAAMDKKMHEALKAEAHPEVRFSASGAGAAFGESQALNGTLNIAGVEQEVAIPIEIDEADGKLILAGEQVIALADYGIEPPTAMFGSIVVGDEVTVKFDLVFTK